MTDIAAFLAARLDEEHQLALDAEYSSGGGTWLFEGPSPDGKSRPGRLKLGDGPWLISDPELRAPTFGDNFDGYQLEHIARHDPARVLAEVAAKRHLLEWCTEVTKHFDWTTLNAPGLLLHDPNARATNTATLAMQTMAVSYADHPDYDASWRL